MRKWIIYRLPTIIVMVIGLALSSCGGGSSSGGGGGDGGGNQGGGKFNIAVNAYQQHSIGAASDGTNFLVGIQGTNAGNTFIAAQLIDSSGSTVGSLIETGRTGSAPSVAFDGTNYLLAWGDDNSGQQEVYGLFIDTSGVAQGGVFAISAQYDGMFSGLAFGGGNYLVMFGETPANLIIRGHTVTTAGVVGTVFQISTGTVWSDSDLRAGQLAFNGTDFLVTWIDETDVTDVKGRLIATNGAPGTEFYINQDSYPSDNRSVVACDTGTGNCLVAWEDDGLYVVDEWVDRGQIVTGAGALSGSVFDISTTYRYSSLAFDGTNYLAVLHDWSNDTNGDFVCDAGEGTCWDLYGQYISVTGSVGSAFTVDIDAGNQVSFVIVYGGSKYLVVIDDGLPSDNVYGRFITP